MRVLVFGVAQHDLYILIPALTSAGHDIHTTPDMLNMHTIHRAHGFEAVVTFVCDDLSAAVVNYSALKDGASNFNGASNTEDFRPPA